MRPRLVVCGLVLLALCCPLSRAAEETEAQRQEAIQKELRALHDSIDALTLRVQALEKKLGGTTPKAAAPAIRPGLPGGPQVHGPDLDALDKITLPANFTKDQAREYITKIMAASHGQNIYGLDDPQVAMLARLDTDNLDVLIDSLQYRGAASYYLVQAIAHLVRPESEAQILAALDRYPNLAQIVIQQGWEVDAKEILINKLKTETKHLPPTWMRATANLHSPEAYGALKQYMIQGQDRMFAYTALSAVHDAGDLGPTVAKALEAARFGDDWKPLTGIAVSYGNVGALEDVITELSDPNIDAEEMAAARVFLARYIPDLGKDQNIAQWFEKNKANIVWDPEAKVYRVKTEQSKPAEAAGAAK